MISLPLKDSVNLFAVPRQLYDVPVHGEHGEFWREVSGRLRDHQHVMLRPQMNKHLLRTEPVCFVQSDNPNSAVHIERARWWPRRSSISTRACRWTGIWSRICSRSPCKCSYDYQKVHLLIIAHNEEDAEKMRRKHAERFAFCLKYKLFPCIMTSHHRISKGVPCDSWISYFLANRYSRRRR